MSSREDIRFMRVALRQARKALGRTSPNPVVGAVVVRDGEVIATGFHRRAGMPHAEVEVLGKLNNRTPDDTLYVTLEPCNHFGKTPPCTKLILESGIKRVVVGMRDPNPLVSGGGCEYLEKKGVTVETGVLRDECARLNEDFLKFVATSRPFVMAKSAITLDGWTATSRGHSQWITNEKSRHHVHRLRDRVDAIMVGAGTILADDPSLTTRFKNKKGKDPIRVVVDTHFRIPPSAKILNHESSAATLIATSFEGHERFKALSPMKGVEALVCPQAEGGLDLNALMNKLGERSIMSVLVEGGATLLGGMVRSRLIDKWHVFVAPKILGGGDGLPMAGGRGPKTMEECLNLHDISVRKFGGDVLIEGYPNYDCLLDVID